VWFERQYLFEPSARYPSVHAASIAMLPRGGLIASWFGGSREGAPDAAIWGADLGPEGWSQPRALADSPGKPDGNSVLWLDGRGTLRLWYVTMEGRGWASCPVRERRSLDAGAIWGTERFIRRPWG
jgi:predicted neuraminidase